MKVSIVVTTYLEKTKKYLDLCLQSIDNLSYPKELIEVILVGRKGYDPEYPNVRTIYPEQEEFHNPVGLNHGFKNIAKDSQYILMLNDDVILTKNSLTHLVNAVGNRKVFANALSPCDNGTTYEIAMGYQKCGDVVWFQKNQHRYEDFPPEDYYFIMNSESMCPPGVIYASWLCQYATLMPASVIQDVGLFDENFKTGQDDLDHCIRAAKVGYRFVSVTSALIFHFGGTSAESTLNIDLRVKNIEYFKSKHGFYPPGMTPEYVEALKQGKIQL